MILTFMNYLHGIHQLDFYKILMFNKTPSKIPFEKTIKKFPLGIYFNFQTCKQL